MEVSINRPTDGVDGAPMRLTVEASAAVHEVKSKIQEALRQEGENYPADLMRLSTADGSIELADDQTLPDAGVRHGASLNFDARAPDSLVSFLAIFGCSDRQGHRPRQQRELLVPLFFGPAAPHQAEAEVTLAGVKTGFQRALRQAPQVLERYAGVELRAFNAAVKHRHVEYQPDVLRQSELGVLCMHLCQFATWYEVFAQALLVTPAAGDLVHGPIEQLAATGIAESEWAVALRERIWPFGRTWAPYIRLREVLPTGWPEAEFASVCGVAGARVLGLDAFCAWVAEAEEGSVEAPRSSWLRRFQRAFDCHSKDYDEDKQRRKALWRCFAHQGTGYVSLAEANTGINAVLAKEWGVSAPHPAPLPPAVPTHSHPSPPPLPIPFPSPLANQRHATNPRRALALARRTSATRSIATSTRRSSAPSPTPRTSPQRAPRVWGGCACVPLPSFPAAARCDLPSTLMRSSVSSLARSPVRWMRRVACQLRSSSATSAR